MTPHDDFKHELTAPLGKLLHAHVIQDQQPRLETTPHDTFVTIESRVTQQISHRIEDAPVVDRVPGLNWRSPEALCDVALVDIGWLDQQDATMLADELAGDQLVDLLATDGCIELPIEVPQCLLIREAGGT